VPIVGGRRHCLLAVSSQGRGLVFSFVAFLFFPGLTLSCRRLDGIESYVDDFVSRLSSFIFPNGPLLFWMLEKLSFLFPGRFF